MPDATVAVVQFSPDLRDDVAAGDVTVSFRLWTRPKVKVGGRYTSHGARIEVDDIELVPFSSVTPADVRRAGERDLESLRARAAHAGPIDDDTLVYRIAFHVVTD
ncbi:MAG: ASCH domain-containing protein [Acidimicrobiia bacterium]